VARRIARGEIWQYRFAHPDRRRPVLVISREEAIGALRTVMVAPITSTRHGIATEVDLDSKHGMKGPCAVNLDHVHTVPQRELRRYVSTLSPELMAAVCRALAVATGCAT
jgi:mRNA interferase MazF